MNTAQGPIACCLLLVAACGRAPSAPERVDDPVAEGTPLRFTGEIVLTGPLARTSEGAVVVSVRRAGGTRALWRRSYEAADPWWTQRDGARSLPFGLSPLDAIVEPAPQLSSTMEIVARWDADGNADTNEPESVEIVAHARTGATDLVLTLGRPPAADLRPGQGISQTAGEPRPSARADGDR